MPEANEQSDGLKLFAQALLSIAEHILEERNAAYERLREQHRPQRLDVLFIAESPPAFDPLEEDLRFFYAPTLTRYDNLYRGIAEALYGRDPGVDVRRKAETLLRFQADGFWLIDAVKNPINDLSKSKRRQVIQTRLPLLANRCRELAPARGVIICNGIVYELAHEPLRAAGVKILQRDPLPFPLGNHRAAFVRGVRAALSPPCRRSQR